MPPVRPPVSLHGLFTALKKRTSKYGVADNPKRTYAGVTYHSAAEAKYAAELDLKKRAGLIAGWRGQVPFQITVNGQRICKVVVDFAVDAPDGTTRYVELKGCETEAYKLKAKLLAACYPNINYTVVRVKR